MLLHNINYSYSHYLLQSPFPSLVTVHNVATTYPKRHKNLFKTQTKKKHTNY